MSQFTASEVRDLASRRDTSAYQARRVMHAFADLLEAQERAVPVAWRSITPDGVKHEWNDDAPSAEDYESARLYGDKIELAFTHPPAASVPGELAEPVAGVINYEQERSFAEGWNACRDAMLAARAKEPQP